MSALLVLVVALGLGLRLWGIGWSLPDSRHPLATYHPDELINLTAAVTADIPHLNLDTGFYSYGTFYFYLVSLAKTVAEGYGLVPTPHSGPSVAPNLAMIALAPQQARLFLIGRLVTALLGTATIGVVYALGRRRYGAGAGLAAGALYAITPLAAVHAHFLTVDVPASFFVACALYGAIRILEEQSWKTYVLAGLWVGLAAATKYNTGLVLAAPLLAHLLTRNPNACALHRRAHLFVLLAVAATAFLVGCPGPIINWDVFWNGAPGNVSSGVLYELFQHSRMGHGYLFVDTGPGWWYHLRISLLFGLGLPLLALTLASLAYPFIRAMRGDAASEPARRGGLLARLYPDDCVLLLFVLFYYGVTGFSAVRFARYMLPLFPVFSVLSGRMLADLCLHALPARRWIPCVVGAAVGALALLYTVGLVRLMALPDPRDVAADYLARAARPGASIAFATVPWYYSPPLSPWFSSLSALQRRKAQEETTRFQLRIPESEWDETVLTPPPDYTILSNIETMHPVYRLRLPAAVRFVQDLPPVARRFAPPIRVYGLPEETPIVPDDLLYIMPVVSLYSPR